MPRGRRPGQRHRRPGRAVRRHHRGHRHRRAAAGRASPPSGKHGHRAVGITVVVSMAIAVTLLPGLLGCRRHPHRPVGHPPAQGHRRRPRDPVSAGGPGTSAAGRRYAVIALAPAGAGRAGASTSCASASPTTATSPTPPSAEAYDLLAEGFGPGFNGPLLMWRSSCPRAWPTPALTSWRTTPWPRPTASPWSEPAAGQPGRRHRVIMTPSPPPAPAGRGDRRARDRLRDDVLPAPSTAPAPPRTSTGSTAASIDLSDRIADGCRCSSAPSWPVVPAAGDRVPLDPGAAQGGAHEPAVDRAPPTA